MAAFERKGLPRLGLDGVRTTLLIVAFGVAAWIPLLVWSAGALAPAVQGRWGIDGAAFSGLALGTLALATVAAWLAAVPPRSTQGSGPSLFAALGLAPSAVAVARLLPSLLGLTALSAFAGACISAAPGPVRPGTVLALLALPTAGCLGHWWVRRTTPQRRRILKAWLAFGLLVTSGSALVTWLSRAAAGEWHREVTALQDGPFAWLVRTMGRELGALDGSLAAIGLAVCLVAAWGLNRPAPHQSRPAFRGGRHRASTARGFEA